MLCHSGGVFNRTNFFAVGDAVNQAFDSLSFGSMQQGVHNGIFITRNFWKEIEDQTVYETSAEIVFSAEEIHIDGILKVLFDSERMMEVAKNLKKKASASFEEPPAISEETSLCRIKSEL
mmetsp:Transcript_31516/g.48186  ORF Transcript_31516/g.48186 Transcript_31516/m.48186 type:complete len:120 (+) Transcript_31516:468-827(+)